MCVAADGAVVQSGIDEIDEEETRRRPIIGLVEIAFVSADGVGGRREIEHVGGSENIRRMERDFPRLSAARCIVFIEFQDFVHLEKEIAAELWIAVRQNGTDGVGDIGGGEAVGVVGPMGGTIVRSRRLVGSEVDTAVFANSFQAIVRRFQIAVQPFFRAVEIEISVDGLAAMGDTAVDVIAFLVEVCDFRKAFIGAFDDVFVGGCAGNPVQEEEGVRRRLRAEVVAPHGMAPFVIDIAF